MDRNKEQERNIGTGTQNDGKPPFHKDVSVTQQGTGAQFDSYLGLEIIIT